MSPPRRKILYICQHEYLDPRYQSPQKSSVLKRLKRVFSSTDIIRTPSQELCPYCQRLEDESQERKAAGQHSRAAAPNRPQTSPLREAASVSKRRSNTVSGGGPYADSFADPAAPRNPYRDTKMQIIRDQFEADQFHMAERVVEGLANEKPADRIARLDKMRAVQRDWEERDAERVKGLPKSWEEMFGPRTPTRPVKTTHMSPPSRLEPSSSGTPAEDAKAEAEMSVRKEVARERKAEKTERVRRRGEEIAKREAAIFFGGWQSFDQATFTYIRKPQKMI